MPVGIEALLQVSEALDLPRKHCLGIVLVQVDTPAVCRIERGQAETLGLVDAIALEQLCRFHGPRSACPLQAWIRKAPTNGGIIGSRSAGPCTIRTSASS